MSLWTKLASFTASAQNGFLSNIIAGAGLAVGSYALHLYYFKDAISSYLSSTDSLPSFGLYLLHASGMDVMIQTILTASLISVSLGQSKVFLKRGNM